MRMDTYTTAADAHDPDKWLAQLHDLWNIAFFFGQEASNSFKKGGCCDHRAITALLPCCTLHAHRYSRKVELAFVVVPCRSNSALLSAAVLCCGWPATRVGHDATLRHSSGSPQHVVASVAAVSALSDHCL